MLDERERAAAARTPNTSNTDRSNPRPLTPRATSEGDTPNRSHTSSTVFFAAPWDTTTPRGTPVEPDVKMT